MDSLTSDVSLKEAYKRRSANPGPFSWETNMETTKLPCSPRLPCPVIQFHITARDIGQRLLEPVVLFMGLTHFNCIT